MRLIPSHFRLARIALGLILVFARVAGAQSSTPVDRVAGWRSDIDVYLGELQRQHYVLKARPLPDSLGRAAERLRVLVPSIGDEQMLVELQRLAAFAGDGHTYVLPFGANRVTATV